MDCFLSWVFLWDATGKTLLAATSAVPIVYFAVYIIFSFRSLEACFWLWNPYFIIRCHLFNRAACF